MKKNNNKWKFVGGVAVALAIAGIAAYALSENSKKNAIRKETTKKKPKK